MPLPSSVEDVMELVIQKQCATMVVLCSDKEMTNDVSFLHMHHACASMLCLTCDKCILLYLQMC